MLTIKHVNGTTFNVNNDDLPWKGKVVQVDKANTDKTDGLVRFYVGCDRRSPEPGRQYCVIGKMVSGKFVQEGYFTVN